VASQISLRRCLVAEECALLVLMSVVFLIGDARRSVLAVDAISNIAYKSRWKKLSTAQPGCWNGKVVAGSRQKFRRGVHTGSRVRLSGQGEAGRDQGNAGDLFLKVEILPHSKFEREGNDLRVTVPIDLYTAVLGGEVDVPSIDRTVKLNIPPETKNGKMFRLRGMGMPKLNKPDERGDLFATVDIQIPRGLSVEEKELFTKLRELRK
jgi:hypothetical protein